MDAPARPMTTDANWTTRRLLKWMTDHFESRGIDAPRVCAEMLLAHALRCERLNLYMDQDRPASEPERAMLRESVKRVAAHEPVQYVVGEAWFFSRAFEVSPATLIPRPETETLVEAAIEFLRANPGGPPESEAGIARLAPAPESVVATESEAGTKCAGTKAARVLDLCTGTGCIAISIALAKGVCADITATDLSKAAIELAMRNAARLGVGREGSTTSIRFAAGDLFSALEAHPPAVSTRFDLITANPPYVSDAEWQDVPANVRDFEPPLALRGGADGLDVIRRVIAGAPAHLSPGGMLLVEIGFAQRTAVLELARAEPELEDAEVLTDHEGRDRVLRASRAERPAAGRRQRGF